ncbi:FMN reductase [Saccharomonospora amisosensis]|uniref:FMN reductase n=1 Tax=Saccharomonospora amisosensis TaxID=1128677 RepID=A0A7X5UTC8_9PSEU|nr:NAD(P)H-dependent oxidoreductase [Saccharomonospora amisosensis]NIJ13820.1 FMN reductase [Saccharomonospora amisosensis]
MTALAATAPRAVPSTTPLRVVVVNGSPSEQSKTMGLADLILDTLRTTLPIEVTRVDVYRLGSGFTGALERDDVPPGIEDTIQTVENADLLIAAAPVFRASVPGMFKHLFDLVDQYALADKPVLLAATGGGDHHALVLEYVMRPLFGFFQALTLPVAIYASAGDFDGTTVLNPRVHGRVEVALIDIGNILAARVREVADQAEASP